MDSKMFTEIFMATTAMFIALSWVLAIFCIVDGFKQKRLAMDMGTLYYIVFAFALAPILNAICFHKNEVFSRSHLNTVSFFFSVLAAIMFLFMLFGSLWMPGY